MGDRETWLREIVLQAVQVGRRTPAHVQAHTLLHLPEIERVLEDLERDGLVAYDAERQWHVP